VELKGEEWEELASGSISRRDEREDVGDLEPSSNGGKSETNLEVASSRTTPVRGQFRSRLNQDDGGEVKR